MVQYGFELVKLFFLVGVITIIAYLVEEVGRWKLLVVSSDYELASACR